MTTEQHVFEVELTVRAHGQEDQRISREYRSQDAASTEKAARELLAGWKPEVLMRLRGVTDAS